MPSLPLAIAPKTRPTPTAAAIAASAASHAFQCDSVVSLATAKPATPNSAVCASDTIPPYPARKARLAAARPVQRTVTATALVKYVENSTGQAAAIARTAATAAYVTAIH